MNWIGLDCIGEFGSSVGSPVTPRSFPLVLVFYAVGSWFRFEVELLSFAQVRIAFRYLLLTYTISTARRDREMWRLGFAA